MLASVVLFAALLPYGMSRNYALFAVFFTALIVLLIDALTHSGRPLAHARLIDALLGCGIALASVTHRGRRAGMSACALR